MRHSRRGSNIPNLLSEQIASVLEAAGITAAQWENGKVVQAGYSLLLSGNAVGVFAIYPEDYSEYVAVRNAAHRVRIDRFIAILTERFENGRMKLDEREVRTWLDRREVSGATSLAVMLAAT